MSHPRIKTLACLPIIALLAGCSHSHSNDKHDPQPAHDGGRSIGRSRLEDVPPFHLKYHYTAESVYRDAEIDGLTLRFTYLSRATLRRLSQQKGRQMESRPLWRPDDLTTETTQLSGQEVKRLMAVVRESGFLELDSVYGPQGRHYPEQLLVRLDKTEKEVVFRHSPQAPPPPPAFVQVRHALFELIDSRFKFQLVNEREPE